MLTPVSTNSSCIVTANPVQVCELRKVCLSRSAAEDSQVTVTGWCDAPDQHALEGAFSAMLELMQYTRGGLQFTSSKCGTPSSSDERRAAVVIDERAHPGKQMSECGREGMSEAGSE